LYHHGRRANIRKIASRGGGRAVDVIEAINERRSIRCFKPDPVPQATLRRITEAAIHSPSASNSQPWELAVVGGARLEKIKQAFVNNSGNPPCPDIPVAARYPEPWDSRRTSVTASILAKLGIDREDKEKRAEWGKNSFRLWGAPTCIYVMIDRSFYCAESTSNVWNIFDCGLIAQDVLLLATENGLGTIPSVLPVLYPDILRKILGLPDSKMIVMAMPIGYEDTASPVN
jgi:nitroreductase